MNDGDFVASNGWLQKLMHRKVLTIRRVMTHCQKSPATLISTLVDFIFYNRKKHQQRQYPYGNIFTADETAIFIDPSRVLVLQMWEQKNKKLKRSLKVD